MKDPTGPVTGSSEITQRFEVEIDLTRLDDTPITHEDIERVRGGIIVRLAGEDIADVQLTDVAVVAS
jgi:hypothetical protein